MIGGCFLGEALTRCHACETALFFLSLVLLAAGRLLDPGLSCAGGGLLLYMGCAMALPESLGRRLNAVSRISAAAGFLTVVFLGFLG